MNKIAGEAMILGAEMVRDLVEMPPEDFERHKKMILADAKDKPRVLKIVETVIFIAAKQRQKLIEIKGDLNTE